MDFVGPTPMTDLPVSVHTRECSQTHTTRTLQPGVIKKVIIPTDHAHTCDQYAHHCYLRRQYKTSLKCDIATMEWQLCIPAFRTMRLVKKLNEL